MSQMQLCRQWQATGQCSYGDDCRYTHTSRSSTGTGLTLDHARPRVPAQDANLQHWLQKINPHATRRTVVQDSASELSKLFHEGLALIDDHVHEGLALIDDHGLLFTHEIVSRLATEGGLSKIDQVTKRLPKLSIESVEGRLLLDALCSICALLTHQHTAESFILEQPLAVLLQYFYGVSGVRCAPCFEKAIEFMRKNKELASFTKPQILQHTTQCFCDILQFVQNAKVMPHFPTLLQGFEELQDPSAQDLAARCTERSIAMSRRILNAGELFEEQQPETAADASLATFERPVVGPGHLAAAGVRHDNDFADISKIIILPTAEECLTTRQDYLPMIDPLTWHIEGFKGLLDRHFRLLREDTVGQLRDAIHGILKTRNAVREANNAPAQPSPQTRVNFHQELFVRSIDFDRHKKLQITVTIKHPITDTSLKNSDHAARWDLARTLLTGGLVCLMDVANNILFCTITSRKQDKYTVSESHNKERAYITLEPLDIDSVAFQAFLSRAVVNPKRNWMMVEFPNIIFPTFAPTLSALQKMNTFAEIPFEDVLMSRTVEDHNPTSDLPAYATDRSFRFDISSITRARDTILDPRAPMTAAELSAMSSLDEAQSHAVIHCLTSRFAMVQGPPGTGKSYVGARVMQILLDNRQHAKIGPILCVCYTNHALDQFLEHCVRVGCRQVVRIGSRSKSEVLESVTLRNLIEKTQTAKAENKALAECHKKLDFHVGEIKSLLHSLSACSRPEALKAYLRKTSSPYLREIFGDDAGNQINELNSQWTFLSHKKDAIAEWIAHGRPAAPVPDNGEAGEQTSTQPQPTSSPSERRRRRALYDTWLEDLRNAVLQEQFCKIQPFLDASNKLQEAKNEVKLRILQDAYIIGATTSGLAGHIDILRRLPTKVLVCEEAAEVLEAHLLTTLIPSLEHAILIGDHRQLRPQIQNFDLSLENERGRAYALNMSLFERLVEPPLPNMARRPLVTLATQRRMHPSISALIRASIYPHLKDHSSVQKYPEIPGIHRRLFWIDHRMEENKTEETSSSNDYEVEMVAALVTHLLRQGTFGEGSIAVLTPYLAQLGKLRSRLAKTFEIVINDRDQDEMGDTLFTVEPPTLVKASALQSVRLATIDNFQGEEADVVLISLVRSNPEKKCGFLRTENRINVLLSRAKHGMYIIGNTETAGSVPMWDQIIRSLRDDGAVGSGLELVCPRHPETAIRVTDPDDFLLLSPEGGCNLNCGLRLDCGHLCLSKCHSEVMHDAVECQFPCERSLKCGHSCSNHCGTDCTEKCRFLVQDIPLPCGHIAASMHCYLQQKSCAFWYKCKESIVKKFEPCGHDVSIPCHEKHSSKISCPKLCGVPLACGHTCLKECGHCRESLKHNPEHHVTMVCEHICDRNYNTCQHRCAEVCHGTKDCPPCGKPCSATCRHASCGKKCHEPCDPCISLCALGCEHQGFCGLPCSAPCNIVPCSRRCEKLLECGHRCPSLCCEPCPAQRYCQVCASTDVKSSMVDYVEYLTYADLDVNLSPIVVPSCGHIISVDSLDGLMSMKDYFELDENARPLALAGITRPFSEDDAEKVCPQCRHPYLGVQRYNRISKRAFLDLSTKKFIKWAMSKFLPLTTLVSELETTLPLLQQQEGFRVKEAETADIVKRWDFSGDVKNIINDISSLFRGSVAINPALKTRVKVATFTQQVSIREQPFSKLLESVLYAQRTRDVQIEASLIKAGPEILQTRHWLLARALLLRCETGILSAFVTKLVKSGLQQRFTLDLDVARHTCLDLAAIATEKDQPSLQAEALIYFARFTAVELQTSLNPERAESLRGEANLNLTKASSICDTVPSARYLQVEIEDAQTMIRGESFMSVVTNEERAAVYAAMATELRGTGHWYYCVNGHPFTIGECGRAMELSSCPQCGAVVGGQRHRAAEGVRRADDMDEEFGRLRLGH